MTAAVSYQIRAHPNIKNPDYKPRGAAEKLIYTHDPAVIIAGPAETGKTLAACWKAHLICSKYAGAQGAILRKSQKSVYGSVLQTFDRVIRGAPIQRYGGEKPEKYIYPSGSVVWVGGMDNADKILSSERDFIYVNQAEELRLDDWEKLTTRTTGRGAVIPYPQLFGDVNPGGSRHWIRELARAGSLTLLVSVHQDNPTLYTEAGELTAQGRRTMARLESLTGVRRKRLLEGIWATAEGAVYDNFDPSVHVVERQPEEFSIWYLAMDEGYTNPAVILLVGSDSDGRVHVLSEYYERGKLQEAVVARAAELHREYGVTTAAVDAAAAGLIADLKNNGVPAVAAKGRVLDGIQNIQNRLQVQGDGRPRLTVDPACVNLINEFESYAWKPEKDEPIKELDHALDALRYLDTLLDVPHGASLVAWA